MESSEKTQEPETLLIALLVLLAATVKAESLLRLTARLGTTVHLAFRSRFLVLCILITTSKTLTILMPAKSVLLGTFAQLLEFLITLITPAVLGTFVYKGLQPS